MKRIAVILLLGLVFSIGVSAQTGTGQASTQSAGEQVKIQDPISREDLKKSLKEAKDSLAGVIRSESEKSAKQIAIDRENARKQNELLAKQKDEQDKKLEAIATAQQEANAKAEADRVFQRKVISVVVGAVVVGLIIVLAVRRKSKIAKAVEEKTTFTVVPKTYLKLGAWSHAVDVRSFIEENPVLKALLEDTGSAPVPAQLTLVRREGFPEDLVGDFECMVIFRKDEDPLVRFAELPGEDIAWKNRNTAAAKIAKARKAVAA